MRGVNAAAVGLMISIEQSSTGRCPGHPSLRRGPYYEPMTGETGGAGAFIGQQLSLGTFQGGVAATLCALSVLVLACAGVWLAAIDIREHRLPRTIVWPLYPVTAVLLGAASMVSGQSVRLSWMLWGLLLTGGVYLALRLIHPAGIGLGDVRLSGVLGLASGFVSVQHSVLALAGTFVLAGVVSLCLLMARRIGPRTHIPFGPFMLLATLGVMAFV